MPSNIRAFYGRPLTARTPADDCLVSVLLQAVQRFVRFAPGVTRAIWERMPALAQDALSHAFYPVAVGNRAGGFALDVPAALTPRAYDVVVAGEPGLDGDAAAWVEAERAAGRRIVHVGEGSLDAVVRDAGIVDAVYVASASDTDAELAHARRLGLRVVSRDAPGRPGFAPFPRVSVVVPTFDGGALVSGAVRALLRNTPWPGLELIVVDNGSHDGTRVLLATHARRDGVVVLSNATNRGFAIATNQGLRHATGEIVVLLNDDTAVGPGWLSRLVAHLEAEPRLGLVCPATNEIGNDARVAVEYRNFDDMERFALGRAFTHAGVRRSLPTVALFCAAARRSTLERLGFLDERYAVGMFEDDDLSRTLEASGLERAVADDAFVHHVGQASFGKLTDAEYLAIWRANRKRFEEKWGVRWTPPGTSKRG
ncbi:MAG TPA: glycosyltransferase family 2 protein [Polyangiaceae bacterium]|jgi:GT2 family glycosyltransferase|nr:glycosyltransferase family 2 protein [Polyangiaceae bacterium]